MKIHNNNRYLVTYDRYCISVGDGDLLGAEFATGLGNVYDLTKVSEASFNRFKRAVQNDVSKRKYKFEGRHYRVVNEEGLLSDFGLVIQTVDGLTYVDFANNKNFEGVV